MRNNTHNYIAKTAIYYANIQPKRSWTSASERKVLLLRSISTPSG